MARAREQRKCPRARSFILAPHHKKGKAMNIVKDRAVQASAVTGGIIAITATIGAHRYPAAFIVITAAWAIATVTAFASAHRRAA